MQFIVVCAVIDLKWLQLRFKCVINYQKNFKAELENRTCDSLHPARVDVVQVGALLWRLHLNTKKCQHINSHHPVQNKTSISLFYNWFHQRVAGRFSCSSTTTTTETEEEKKRIEEQNIKFPVVEGMRPL